MNDSLMEYQIRDQLAIIVAMDKNNLIGKDNHIPWHFPEDLAYFRQVTLDHNVIMGKNTWLSIGKTLDRRTNIVLSRDPAFHPPGCIICPDIPDALTVIGNETSFVIGGASVFKQFLPIVGKLYLTRIDAVFEGDKFFPHIDFTLWILDYYEVLSSQAGVDLKLEVFNRIRSI